MNCLKLIVAGLMFASVSCFPKFNDPGFKPSFLDYSEKSAKSQDQLAVPSNLKLQSDQSLSNTGNEITDRSQEPRFGFTNLAGNTGYGLSGYTPARIDLGGLLLGAAIGIGTVLVIPKLLYLLSGGYDTYARSYDGGISQAMTRLDDTLARHGIDTTSCMQRVVCSYSKQAAEAVKNVDRDDDGDQGVSNFDKLVNSFSSNQMLRGALQGTAIQEAMEAGHDGQNCAKIYHTCSISSETILTILAKLAANNVGDYAKGATAA